MVFLKRIGRETGALSLSKIVVENLERGWPSGALNWGAFVFFTTFFVEKLGIFQARAAFDG